MNNVLVFNTIYMYLYIYANIAMTLWQHYDCLTYITTNFEQAQTRFSIPEIKGAKIWIFIRTSSTVNYLIIVIDKILD